jgi:hypothetical protein
MIEIKQQETDEEIDDDDFAKPDNLTGTNFAGG